MAKRLTKSSSPFDVSFAGDERIVVIYGKELFLQAEHTRRLREAVELKKKTEVEVIRLDGEKSPLADVLDELRSFGLMQQHKMVVVTDADEFVKKHREAMERYAQSPEEAATLVLRAEKWNPGKLDKLIQKFGQIIKCDPPTRPQAQAWIVGRASETYGVKLPPDAAGLLVEHIGADLGRLDAELGKLAVGAPDGAAITVTQVQAITGFASDEAAWEIQDALLSGHAKLALEKLHELLDLSGQPKELLTFFIADLLRKMHHANVMLKQNMRPWDIFGQLKVWPRERQQPFLTAAQRLGAAKSAMLLEQIVEMDRRSKSGLAEGELNLERFCVAFTEALR